MEEAPRDLPKLLAAGNVRSVLGRLPILEAAPLTASEAFGEKGMLLLSYFGHAYVWGEAEPASRIPRAVAVPWRQLSRYLGRPLVLSYASRG